VDGVSLRLAKISAPFKLSEMIPWNDDWDWTITVQTSVATIEWDSRQYEDEDKNTSAKERGQVSVTQLHAHLPTKSGSDKIALRKRWAWTFHGPTSVRQQRQQRQEIPPNPIFACIFIPAEPALPALPALLPLPYSLPRRPLSAPLSPRCKSRRHRGGSLTA
jgi:hypothetical protein